MKARISINGKRIEKYFKTEEQCINWRNLMIEKHSDKSLNGEIWKSILGFSRYEASNFGRVRALNYKNSGLIKILKPAESNGYLKTVLINDNGKYKSLSIHKIITLAFYGERMQGQEVNHKDGNKLNNSIINLEYCTRSDNVKHSYDNGLQSPMRGEDNASSKLTDKDVIMIKCAKMKGGRFWGRNEIAKKLGISAGHVKDIANDKSWNHI